MPRPVAMRPAEEVVPKLGARPGLRVLRVGGVAAYDRPLEHVCGELDHVPLRLPLPGGAGRYGLVLCFALEDCDAARLARELVRVAHPEGSVWVAVWKRDHERAGAPSWEEVQRTVLTTGWVDNKILSFGEQVYATRYVRRRRGGNKATGRASKG